VEYRILGPLQVIADKPVDLGGRTQRTLLGVLLASPGRLVSLPYLVDAVWDDRPPGTAKRQVQNYVSALRRALADAGAPESVIVSRGPGYQLRPGPGELDAEVFGDQVADALRLASAGRREDAVVRLRSALGLWRGPALFDLTGRAIDAAAARLEEQRLAAVEHRIGLELALGCQHDLVGELTELVAAHPFREQLVRHLMMALYGSGRRSDALQAYSRYCTLLADELGLDPGVALRQVHEAILRDEPVTGTGDGGSASARVALPAQLPADVSGFTGRSDQINVLDGLLPHAYRPGTAVIICAITGMGGVGKTALAVHWAHRVRARFPDGQLFLNLRGQAGGPPMPPSEALSGLLRSLGVSPEEISADVEVASGQYRSLLAARRVLVVLDNAASADQVRPLLPAGPGSVVLVTSRDRLTGLVARDGAERFTLDVLDPGEALLLLARLLSADRVAAEPDAAAELARACSYLPLALRIAAANAADRPWSPIAEQVTAMRDDRRLAALEIAGDERASVRRAFDLSYEIQPPDARRQFRLLGIVPGPDVTAEAAGVMSGTTLHHAATTLDSLVGAHLVIKVAPGRYALHDILRQFAADRARNEEPAAEREAALRRLSGWYLHSCDAAAKVLYPHRLRLPVPPAGPDAAKSFADEASSLSWLDAERANLVAAIRHAAEQQSRSAAWLLADTLRPYFWLRLHTADWAETAAVALDAARAEGDVQAEAAALLSLGDTADRQNRREAAIEHYTRALTLAEQTGWGEAATAALGKLGSQLMESGRLRESAEYYRRALTYNAAGGSPHAEAVVLGSLGSIHFQLGQLDEAISYYTRALALFREIGARQGEAAALGALGEVRHAQGRLDEAAEHLTQALELEREIGDRGSEASSLRTLVSVYRDRGQTTRAVELAKAAVALADELDDRRLKAEAHNALGFVRAHAGRHWDAVEEHSLALELARRTGYRYTEVEALLGLAAAHVGLADNQQALDHARQALAIAGEVGFGTLASRASALLRTLR
jgi:DNA-binding SARP family transcriptional activator/Tfp pilus assembly protein PilF